MKESVLQISCVEYAQYALKPDVVFWATANERKAKPQYIAMLKRMGMRAGVADLVFMSNINEMAMLFIEFKRPTTYKRGKRGKDIIDQKGGEQSPVQEQFQKDVEAIDAHYYVVDNIANFKNILIAHELVKGT